MRRRRRVLPCHLERRLGASKVTGATIVSDGTAHARIPQRRLRALVDSVRAGGERTESTVQAPLRRLAAVRRLTRQRHVHVLQPAEQDELPLCAQRVASERLEMLGGFEERCLGRWSQNATGAAMELVLEPLVRRNTRAPPCEHVSRHRRLQGFEHLLLRTRRRLGSLAIFGRKCARRVVHEQQDDEQHHR